MKTIIELDDMTNGLGWGWGFVDNQEFKHYNLDAKPLKGQKM